MTPPRTRRRPSPTALAELARLATEAREHARAPHSRTCHPQEDHLVPLFVALGAAETEMASMIYHEESFMGGITASSYRFG